MVGRVATAPQVFGGSLYRDYAVERFYRDVRILRLYEGHDTDPADGHRS
jgi:acyl-CoA dehydrogenase